MNDLHPQEHPPERHEATDRDCITILARDSAAATQEFNRLGLGRQGFAIAGRVERHRFAFADGSPAPFDGEPLFAATYIRAS